MSSPATTVYADPELQGHAEAAQQPAAGFQREPQPVLSLDSASALQFIAGHRGPMLVDFDETLFLRNSTECFLDCAQPSVLALLLLRLLDLLKPWRLSGGEMTRDNWRVGLIATLLPWTWWAWQRRVATLAKTHTNQPLLQALRAHGGESLIVSIGFQRIIAPLARAMGADNMRLVGSRLLGGDRRRGKLALCVAALGEPAIEQALGLSDSAQDTPLLERCRSGLLVQWPEARFEHALRQVYLPGQYISRIKHPGQRYILRAILQEDFALWLLASLALAWSPLWHCVGLLLLLVSFWAIYEQGYADNDRCGMRYEDEPKLSVEFFTEEAPARHVEPWIWAAGCGVLGLFALRRPFDPLLIDYLAWGAVLVGTHFLFRLYNRIDKPSRVWLYSGLQFARGAAFVAVAAVSPVGVAALGAHIFARWAPYCFYRQGGKRWVSDTFHLMRLVLFFWFALLLGVAYGPAGVLNWTGAALLAWMLYRARRELVAAWKTAHRIDQPKAIPPKVMP